MAITASLVAAGNSLRDLSKSMTGPVTISMGPGIYASQKAGDAEAVRNYLAFLRSGGSKYPLEGLKLAGVDMSSPEPVASAFAALARMVDRLEELVAARR